MNQKEYINQEEVQGFITWLGNQLGNLQIELNIKKSRFVPRAVANQMINGLVNVPNHYQWKAKGLLSGTWEENNVRLAQLATELQQAVAANNSIRAFNACCAIIDWGGDRNSAKGATPFLQNMGNDLCAYIKKAGEELSLSRAQLGKQYPSVTRMNSMLTKIHALYSTDGLPIYDSRVAAAIATLVEMWRRSTDAHRESLPSTLVFPATLLNRSVKQKYPDAANPGTFSYDKTYVTTTTIRWAEAKVRLGWLMSEVLTNKPEAFVMQGASLASRMRAMEASLFMVGYDVTCLN